MMKIGTYYKNYIFAIYRNFLSYALYKNNELYFYIDEVILNLAKHPLTNQILNIVRTKAYKENMSISNFAEQAGVSKAWISKLRNTSANFSVETASRLLNVCGYKLVIIPKNKTK